MFWLRADHYQTDFLRECWRKCLLQDSVVVMFNCGKTKNEKIVTHEIFVRNYL